MIPTLLPILLLTTYIQDEVQERPRNSDIENIGNRDINRGLGNFNSRSMEQEIALGRQLAAEMESRVTMVADPAIIEYVNRIGQKVAANSDAQVPITIKVIEAEELDVLSLPGGFVYVNDGVIQAADNEAELASTIAYAIAHVAARHATENASKGEILNISSIPLIFLGGPIGYTFRQNTGVLIPLQFLEFDRDNVDEADFLGLQYLYKAGYNPDAAITILEKLKAEEDAQQNPTTTSKMFPTHPPSTDRIERIRRNIELILSARADDVLNTDEFSRMKQRLAAIRQR